MRHPARVIAIGAAVLVAAFAVVLATQVGGDPRSDATTSRLLSDPVPAFSVRTLDGDVVRAADLEGRAVIVNFWNTWCIPCIDELPALKEFYGQHSADPDFLMLGIVRDDTEQAVRAYVRAQGMDWTIGLDPDASAALAFGTRGQPETFAITPDGVIVGFQLSEASVDDLETLLARARGETR